MSFARGPRRREVRILSDARPVRCAAMLATGEAEAALAPVSEYQRGVPGARRRPRRLRRGEEGKIRSVGS